MSARLPKLDIIDASASPSFVTPAKLINETSHVSHFLKSKAYRDICTFIMQLNRSVCPRVAQGSPVPIRFPLSSKLQPSPPVSALQSLLSSIDALIQDAPPVPGPQRFGNISFRTWHSLLETKAAELLQTGLLNDTISAAPGSAAEVTAYLLGGFGSAQRIDYGTGHELSFIAFIGCLWKLGFFKGSSDDSVIEREIVLQVIQPYLELIRKLILTYNLEPAGTHGVWGLDDHSFAPYIFGSAQLTRPINDNEPMPLEGSVRGAPKPGDITKAVTVEDERQTNMYFSAIGFINDIKKGPFWEHSPMLFDISGVKDGWGKINKGMIKMYNAEVLSKFPVVQHFPFGSLFSWDEDPEAAQLMQGNESTQHLPPTATMPNPSVPSGTGAPWAATTRMPPPPNAGMMPSVQGNAGGGSISVSRPGDRHNVGDGPTKAPWAK